MNERDYLIETMTTELTKLVIENGVANDIQSALDAVYNSETYDKLCDERTRLMFQHPGYVYCYLRNELLTGTM